MSRRMLWPSVAIGVASLSPAEAKERGNAKSKASETAAALREELTIERRELSPGGCTLKAKPGSKVAIEHTGYIHSVPDEFHDDDLVGKLIDRNIEGEPLRVNLRSGKLIRGLDLALEGMCKGEQFSVIMPPHLAFDDPTMKFNWGDNGKNRPCPQGASLRYEVNVVDIEGGEVVPREDFRVYHQFGLVILMVLAVSLFTFFRYRNKGLKSKSRQAAASAAKQQQHQQKKARKRA